MITHMRSGVGRCSGLDGRLCMDGWMQVKLLARYKVQHEVVGSGADARLRILPQTAKAQA